MNYFQANHFIHTFNYLYSSLNINPHFNRNVLFYFKSIAEHYSLYTRILFALFSCFVNYASNSIERYTAKVVYFFPSVPQLNIHKMSHVKRINLTETKTNKRSTKYLYLHSEQIKIET